MKSIRLSMPSLSGSLRIGMIFIWTMAALLSCNKESYIEGVSDPVATTNGGGGTGGGGTTSCETPVYLSSVVTQPGCCVRLSWEQISGAQSYEIVVVTPGPTITFTANTNYIELSGYTGGYTYSWKVRAVCGGGLYSPYSEWRFFST